jgi:soluble lytic murein transglycosylase
MIFRVGRLGNLVPVLAICLGCFGHLGCISKSGQRSGTGAERTLASLVEQNFGWLPEGHEPQIDEKKFAKFIELVDRKGTTRASEVVCAVAGDALCTVLQAPRFRVRSDGANALSMQGGRSVGGKWRIKDLMVRKKYSELSSESPSRLIGALKTMAPKARDQVTASALDLSCDGAGLQFATASVLENDFPSTEKVLLTKRLLERAAACPSSDVVRLANFRLGLLQVWDQECGAAVPRFLASRGHSIKTYDSRAEYWGEYCQAKSTGKRQREPASLYEKYPLSLHPLLAIQGERFDATDRVRSNLDIPIVVRSDRNQFLNAALTVTEKLLRHDRKRLAASILEKIDWVDLAQEPDGLQLYLGYVAGVAEHELLKFQVLSQAFVKNPKLKTVASLNLYYPRRYWLEISNLAGDLDPYLLMALVRQESAFNKEARSPKNARGLMQIMPTLARSYGFHPKDMFTPEKNLKVGVGFFRHLMKRFNGQVPLALAAYNAGPKMVESWLSRYPTENPVLFMDLIPFRETREYVASILRNWYWYTNLMTDRGAPELPLAWNSGAHRRSGQK